MCDYSLMHAKSRPAAVGDKLTIHNFGAGTRGFKADDDAGSGRDATAVCLLPGTELAFDYAPAYGSGSMYQPDDKQAVSNVARFRQINKEDALRHHDALEFGTGEFVLLTAINEGQHCTVLQLPAAPKNDAEAKEQERLEVVA